MIEIVEVAMLLIASGRMVVISCIGDVEVSMPAIHDVRAFR